MSARQYALAVPALAVLVVSVAFSGCAQTRPNYSEGGDLEVKGWSSGYWTNGGVAEKPNFKWDYLTEGFVGDETEPFHRMRTELEIAYDPKTGEVSNARLKSSEMGGAYRHICLTPTGGILRIRMVTLFVEPEKTLTVLKVHGTDPSTHTCEDIGVGPKDGLVEGLEVIFAEDGTFEVVSSTGASLFGSNLRVTRVMSGGSRPDDRDVAEFPPPR
jgi:hypothetical protein